MAVSAMWIRDNMLYTSDQFKRKLTEAELKVQRSLQKLSIPDWYLNKRSSPPKILSNVTPIESRPPSWKNVAVKMKSTADTPLKNFSVTLTLPRKEESRNCKAINDCGTYKVSRQPKSPEAKPRKSSKSSAKNEVFDTTIPRVKLSTNISKTFPKVSPSRKIQHINIVFPSGPKPDISSTLEDDSISEGCKYSTFILKKQPLDLEKQNDSEKHDESSCTTPTKKTSKDDSLSEALDTSFRTPNVKGNFKVRAVSTPKYTPSNLFSSTAIEDSSKTKKDSETFLENSSILDDSSNTKISQVFLEKVSIFETTPKRKLSQSLEETPIRNEINKNRASLFLERNIRSVDPILFEKDDAAPSPSLKCSILVQEIVEKLDSKKQHCQETKSDPSKDQLQTVAERRTSLDMQSPCARFFHSRKKSTELENIVKSETLPRGKGFVRGIIEELNEKCKFSSTRQNVPAVNSQNFVKKLVNALETGDTSQVEEVLVSRRKSTDEFDTGSCSESDAKSAASSTSISLKDTDSSSDSDQRSPSLRSDEENTFDYGLLAMRKLMENDGRISRLEEEDSVYWIPVSKCKLPRTSSLLSMMSRLSGNGQSPCVSPIRSDSEGENQSVAWGTTFKKSNASARKLFRIDETAVADSGYSDRSDRSGASSGSSIVDGTWSEDTQNDSGNETRSSRLRKSSRRKTIVVQRTFLV